MLLVAVVKPLIAQQGQPESVCPLTQEQTQKSIAAFAKITPLFRHPRCINCHGGVDPFSENGGHEGGQVDTTTDCSTCHDDFKGIWEVAPEPISFVGKDDEALCEQMKDFFEQARGKHSFVGHMTNDNNLAPFIEAGLEGRKGMVLTKGEVAEKPPGWDHPKLIQLSNEWIDAMGGRFHGDKSCGCKAQTYFLDLDYEVKIDLTGIPLISGLYETKTQGQNLNALEIPLKIKTPGSLDGEAVMTLQGQGHLNTPIGGCTGQDQQSFLVHATGTLEEGDEKSGGRENKLNFTLKCKEIQLQSDASCPHGSGSETRFSPCTDDVKVNFAAANVDKPQTQSFPVPFPGSSATLTGVITKDE
jgi:hypothetical protein